MPSYMEVVIELTAYRYRTVGCFWLPNEWRIQCHKLGPWHYQRQCPMDADCGLRLMSNMQVLMSDAVQMGDTRLEHMQVSCKINIIGKKWKEYLRLVNLPIYTFDSKIIWQRGIRKSFTTMVTLATPREKEEKTLNLRGENTQVNNYYISLSLYILHCDLCEITKRYKLRKIENA